MNSDPFAIWAMLDDERRSGWRRGFGINPALSMADITLKEVRANHAVHCSPQRRPLNDFAGVLGSHTCALHTTGQVRAHPAQAVGIVRASPSMTSLELMLR
jgi:hypothetical protein